MFGFLGSMLKEYDQLVNVPPTRPAVTRPAQPPIARPLPQQALPELEGDDTESQPNQVPCCVCYTNSPKVTLVPCGHLCLCIGCYNQLRQARANTICPACRVEITLAVKTFQ